MKNKKIFMFLITLFCLNSYSSIFTERGTVNIKQFYSKEDITFKVIKDHEKIKTSHLYVLHDGVELGFLNMKNTKIPKLSMEMKIKTFFNSKLAAQNIIDNITKNQCNIIGYTFLFYENINPKDESAKRIESMNIITDSTSKNENCNAY